MDRDIVAFIESPKLPSRSMMRFLHPGTTWEDLAMQIVKAYADGDLVERGTKRLYEIKAWHPHDECISHDEPIHLRAPGLCQRCNLEIAIRRGELLEVTFEETSSEL